MPEPKNASEFEPVSFVIPAHNETDYLPATLDSVRRAALSQNIDYEIIVVNDGSTDDTKALAIQHGAKAIDVNLRNIGAVRNAGAKVAAHPWLIFLDADTILPSETLRGTLCALRRGDVGGGAFVRIGREQRLSINKYLMYLTVVLIWQFMGRWAAGCYMYCLKTQFEDFGGFDEDYYAAEELFFSRELKARGRFTLIKAPVVTSARKLHSYSTLQLIRFLFRPMLAGRNIFRTKEGLEILYEDNR